MPRTDVNRLIRVLSETSSATEKKTYLATLKSDVVALEVFKLALDPFITFGILPEEIPDTKDHYDKALGECWPEVRSTLKRLAARQLTGNAARTAVQTLLPGVAGPIVARIIGKDLRCGVQAKTVNAVLKGCIPEFLCALATDAVEKATYPCWAEPKYDGVRTLGVKRNGCALLFSRNGKEYTNFPHIVKALEALPIDNVVFDGECMGETFKQVTESARRKGGKSDETLDYCIFDLLTIEEFFSNQCLRPHVMRRQELEKLKLSKPLRLTPHKLMHDEAEMRAYFREQRNAGYEGLILKHPDAPYEFKRGRAFIKVKEMETHDGVVTGYEEGTGKYKGMLGALIAEFDGVQSKVGSGYDDSMRKALWAERDELEGRWIEVQAQEKTEDGCLRFPVFLRFREDKE